MKKSPIESQKIGADVAKVLELKEPFDFGGEEIKSLKFKKMKGKHLKGVSAGELKTDSLFLIASRLTDMPPSVFDEMGGEDAMGVIEIVSGFLVGSRPTGGIV